MIKILNKIPREVVVACSGGIDSMAVVDFLKRNHKVELAFFHHGTTTSEIAFDFLKEYAKKNELILHFDVINSEKQKGESQEEFWRNQRYKFFEKFDKSVITCHHLNDVLETWIFSSAHGQCKLIPYRRNNVIRPFLLNKKEIFEKWCKQKDVPFVEDITNKDIRYKRNFIRHKVVPLYTEINCGIYKVLKKQIILENKNKENTKE